MVVWHESRCRGLAKLCPLGRLELPQVSRGNSRMTATEQISAPAANSAVTSTLPAQPLQRPSFVWTLRGAAPVHDFPIRDEILFQFTPPISGGKYLEIGAGSGYTAYCLARQADHLTIADYAEVTLADLRGKLGAIPNIGFAQADLSKPNLARSEERRVGKECRSRWSPHH